MEKLCYIEGDFAYFTTQKLKDQWGDDWNDVPYECNAEVPYEWHDSSDGDKWEIKKVAFECASLMAPCDQSNNGWSVEDINAGKIAWLGRVIEDKRFDIYAGVSIEEFGRLVTKAGGTVYYAREYHIGGLIGGK